MVKVNYKGIKRLMFSSLILILSVMSVQLFSVKVNADVGEFVIKKGVLVKYKGSKSNVIVPKTVIYIGNNAFGNNKKIVTVTLPDTVIDIGDRSFNECSSLIEINLPDSLVSIGRSAFEECARLKKITIPDKVKYIGAQAFSQCSELKQVKLPAGVISISEFTFMNCSSLDCVSIPDNVTEIGINAFSNCIGLKTVYLSKNLTSIGAYAFTDCYSLKSVNIPKKVQKIGLRAFYATPWYETLTSENNLFIVNDKLFDASKAKGKVFVPEGVIEIGDRAFQHAKVEEVVLPESIVKLGEESFATRSLANINLPKRLTEIGNRAFYHTRLTNTVIPGSVTAIGDGAYASCDKLKTVVIADGVKSIGKTAFEGCIMLERITIPKTLTSIGRDAFHNDNMLLNINISPENPEFTAQTFFLLSKDKKILLQCARTQGTITIPEGVEATAEAVFHGTGAEEISFPSTMKKLSNNLFYGCEDLSYIRLPASLNNFGEQSFEFCRDLKEIKVYNVNNQINIVSDNGVLYNADKTILLCDPTIGNVVVPDHVTSIGNYAFPNSDISVTIPKSVKELGDKVFNTDMLWKPANETPFCVYGYTQSMTEKYCYDKGIKFLAFDGVYSINYNLEGGVNSSQNPTSYTYSSDDIIFKNPKKPGYKFLYWYEDISICEDGCCRGERIVNNIPEKSMGNIELIAKWEKINI